MLETRWARRLSVVVVTVAASALTFWIILQISPPPWKTSEYAAIAFWSLPLGFLVLLIAKLPRRWFARSNVVVRLFVSVVLAAIAAIVWTYLAVGLTGGYALAFDANPLHCWAVGSLVGMLTALNWPISKSAQANGAPSGT
jgi:hypothetical protein